MAKKDDTIKEFSSLKGVGKKKAELLFDSGLDSMSKLKKASVKDLTAIEGFNEKDIIVLHASRTDSIKTVDEKGIKPGEDHAKWILYPVRESDILTWHDFSAKNRVAHSTKKNLLIGILDEENDVTYYEIRWTKP